MLSSGSPGEVRRLRPKGWGDAPANSEFTIGNRNCVVAGFRRGILLPTLYANAGFDQHFCHSPVGLAISMLPIGILTMGWHGCH